MTTTINWKLVSDNLRCPICGEKASIAPETDGTEGYHLGKKYPDDHRFYISRDHALALSQTESGTK